MCTAYRRQGGKVQCARETINPLGQNGFRSFRLQNGPIFNSQMVPLLIWRSLGDTSSMKQTDNGFFILIPGRYSQEKGGWAKDYNRFYNLYQAFMKGTHKTCYSKLQFLAFLAKRCNNPTWVHKHWCDLISMYFLLIYDRALLFAQTREDRSPINGYTCLEFATNRSNGRETCEKIMEGAINWFLGDFRASVLYRDTGLTEAALRKILSVVEKDWLHNKKGRRRKLYYCPEKPWEELCYRDADEPEADWARRREESLYQIIQVLRIPAPNYYLQHHNDLAITEMQWREIVVNCLGPIGRRVEQELKDQMSYRPYFLRDQLSALSKLEARAKKDADLFLRLNKIWNKSSIFDEVTLPNSITSTKKVERFSQMIKHLEESPTPFEAGLLFLMRANMHRLFGGRRSSDLENIPGVAVGDARRFFDRIQTESEACLVYSERNLISWNPTSVRIKLDELIQSEEYLQLRSQVCLKFENSLKQKELQSVAKEYSRHFFSPVYPQDRLRPFLQDIVSKLDWSGIPVDNMWEKIRYSKAVGTEVLQRNLVEYACIQLLIRKGYDDLREISHAVFRATIMHGQETCTGRK